MTPLTPDTVLLESANRLDLDTQARLVHTLDRRAVTPLGAEEQCLMEARLTAGALVTGPPSAQPR